MYSGHDYDHSNALLSCVRFCFLLQMVKNLFNQCFVLFQESNNEKGSATVFDLSDINHSEDDGSLNEGNSVFIL